MLVDFDKTHPGTKTIILNQNYRSTPQILKCANVLIEKNNLRLKKDLFTNSESGVVVKHIHSKSEEDEVSYIVKEIKEIKKLHNKSYSDFAILYRSSFLSRVIERKLVEENIPYEIFGGVKFYQRMEIQDVIAYLRVIAFNDDLSFKRIINTPRRQFGRVRVAALETIRENNDMTLFDQEDLQKKTLYEVLKTHLCDPAFNGSGGGAFISLIENMKNLKDKIKISELVNCVCIESGYEQYIRELGDEERLDNLSEFKRIANEFENGFGEDVSLETFLQQIAIMSAEDSEKPCESVKLMTIHASKGLEFPVVFILGFSEGIFPSSKTIEERKKLGLEEERRLCYVAITRAQEILYLMDSEGQSQQGIKKLPSRFLYEIGEENYQRIGRISDDLERESWGYIHRLNREMIEELPAPQNDGIQMIEHHIFGKGRVLSFDSKRKVYSVQFDGVREPRAINADYFNQKHESILPENIPQLISQDLQIPHTVEEAVDEDEDLYRKLPHYEEEFEDEPDHWNDPDFPKIGWVCTGITDLGSPFGICQMCGFQIIRYVHHMYHMETGRQLDCGCICAGKLEGDIDKARKREAAFKNKEQRKINFKKKKWKCSSRGNEYLKIKNHLIVLFHFFDSDKWNFSIDNVFNKKAYATRDECIEGIFNALEELLYK